MEAAFPLQKGLSRDRFTNVLSIPLKVSSGMQCKSHIFAIRSSRMCTDETPATSRNELLERASTEELYFFFISFSGCVLLVIIFYIVSG